MGRERTTTEALLSAVSSPSGYGVGIVDAVASQVASRWTTPPSSGPTQTAACVIRLDRNGRRLIMPEYAGGLGPRLRELFEVIDGFLDQPETEALDPGWSIEPNETTDVALLPSPLADAAVAAGLASVRRWDVVGASCDAAILVAFGRGQRTFDDANLMLLDDAVRLLDGTLRQQADDRLLRLAIERDPLTELGNRLGFDRTMTRMRSDAGGDIGCLYVDVDHFKEINDTWGHRVGDAILSEVARRISRVCRDADVVARLGGDEFAVLLVDTTADELGAIAERLVRAIAAPLDGFGPSSVTASIGCSFGDAASVLDDADGALYASKRAGRNCAVMADAVV